MEEIPLRLLNVREAARYLGMCVRTVWRRVHEKLLPVVKIGRCTRFSVADLDAFIAKHRRT